MVPRVLGSLVLAMFLSYGYALADVDIQYRLPVGAPTDGWVTAVRDTPPSIESTEGYGIVTLTGIAVADIVWPTPVAGCLGKPEWTRVTDPSNVTVAGEGMALRVGLVFFTTTSPLLPGCHLVSGWSQLRTLVEGTVIAAVQANDLMLTLNQLNVAAQVRCPGATGGATCDSVRASMATLNGSYPSPAVLNTFLSQVVTLRSSAITFRDERCKDTPGGPFC